MNEFHWPVRIYYEDTDTAGVVYYANYLKFMERARTEMLRSLGIEQDDLREHEGVVFAVRSVQVDYISPARFNDRLQVVTRISNKGKASLNFDHEIKREDDQQILCTGQARIACVHLESLRPAPIPESIQMEINRAG